MRLRRFSLALIFLSTLLATHLASAQTPQQADLSRPDSEEFPIIQAYLDVRDEYGEFIHGLRPQNVHVIEGTQTLPVLSLVEQRPGVQFILALNPAPAFGIRNSQGVSRYDLMMEALKNWASSRLGSSVDDLSFVVTDQAGVSHLSNPADWHKALNQLQIDPRQAEPDLETLARAIDLAADAPSRTGMGKAILFITPPLIDVSESSFQDLITRANQQDVALYIWMVAPPNESVYQAATQLQNLAEGTGGKYFVYADGQPVPDLEEYLSPLRSIYNLSYESQIRSSGSYSLAVEIQTETGQVTTPVQNLVVNLQPPSPAFVAPPLEIRRKPPMESENDNTAQDEAPLTVYTPTLSTLQVLVAFPDERVRPLERTSLYVDGLLVDENRTEPFDRFSWELTQYESTGTHLLRVEAEDKLGLVGSSIENLVLVAMDQPERNPWSWLTHNALLLSVLVAAVAGIVLLLVLILGGRIQPRRASASIRRRRSDPVTQPVPVKQEPPRQHRSGWANRLQWPQRNLTPKAYAYLTRIIESDESASPTPTPITTGEVTLGSDPNLATIVIDDPAVEGLHARLMRLEDGSFRIADQGSIAGTWVNYTPITTEGIALEHGDLLHIGRIGFRFSLRDPTKVRKPAVTLITPDQPKL